MEATRRPCAKFPRSSSSLHCSSASVSSSVRFRASSLIWFLGEISAHFYYFFALDGASSLVPDISCFHTSLRLEGLTVDTPISISFPYGAPLLEHLFPNLTCTLALLLLRFSDVCCIHSSSEFPYFYPTFFSRLEPHTSNTPKTAFFFSYVSLFLLSPHIVVLLTSYFSPVSISVHTDYSFLFHFRFYLESCFLSSFFLSNLLLGAPFFNFFYVSPLLCLLTLPYPFT